MTAISHKPMKTKQLKSGINEFREMANMPGVVLEIFKSGGGWTDQNGPTLEREAPFPYTRDSAKCRILDPEAGKAYTYRAEEVGETLLFRPFGSVMFLQLFLTDLF
ncbi:hypothetical protein T10_16 [Trichinella papuae]|uniref:Uncharacterized protein n=1 Tax=Trichinella papuae TaxID=268474 RepID=A0A0V1M0E1_9BILA|nr:hypothetical protein T10_16 [Trichinella papuae]